MTHSDIKDFISGHVYYGTEEDKVVQLLARWLVAIGYGPEQIQTYPQYVPFPDRKMGSNPLDLAVFRDSGRTPDNLIIVAEVKKDDGGNAYSNGRGLDQLHRILTKTSAIVGIWFNGIDFVFMFHFRGVGESFRALESGETFNRASFGMYLDKARRKKKGPRGGTHRFSIRQIAGRVGIEPSYLSKIMNGSVPPPSMAILEALIEDLDLPRDEVFLRAGKLPPDMSEAFSMQPKALASILEGLKDAPADVLSTFARKVRDGKW